MSVAVNSQDIALQMEHVDELVALLIAADSGLYNKIGDVTGEAISVSTRNARFPFLASAGGAFAQTSFDNADMGLGSADTYDVFQIQPVYFAQAVAISKLAEWATEGDHRAVKDFFKDQIKRQLAQFKAELEALYLSDGSGTLGTVVTASSSSGSGAETSYVTTNSAPNFFDGQLVQFWTAVGGSQRGSGSIAISSVDVLAKKLWFASALPASTTTGDIIIANGGTAAAGSSILGVYYYQNNSTSGSVNGINRTTYPGKMTTPSVNLNSNAVTVSQARLGLQLIRTALGDENPAAKDITWVSNTDQQAAMENLALQVAITNQQDIKDSGASQDMGTKFANDKFLGREVLVSIHAQQGRIDGLALKPSWGRISLTDGIKLYDVGGQTVFPVYGASGGLASATQFYWVVGENLINRNPRAGCFLSGAAIPTGY